MLLSSLSFWWLSAAVQTETETRRETETETETGREGEREGESRRASEQGRSTCYKVAGAEVANFSWARLQVVILKCAPGKAKWELGTGILK